MMLEKNH